MNWIISCSTIRHCTLFQLVEPLFFSSLPLSPFVHLFFLPPHLRCWRSVTSSPRPHLWQRKTPPTGTASRWRLKLRRDREMRTHPNNHLSHADNHLPHTHIHTPFRSERKRHTHIVTLKLLSHSTQVLSRQGEFIYKAKTHKFVSEDFRVHTASDTFSL